ncbi:GNAT family N-acetyltransferase [Lederbergia graminis]|uniref:GNAT family N-acetyltransferase n=1 Tax=Lederbergia graminis TaxID=735518 RepID=A0ABW0LLH0_9BACI
MKNVLLTDRVQRIIRRAEQKAAAANAVVTPIHLLASCLLEKTGVLGEIFLKCDIDIQSWKQTLPSEHDSLQHPFVNTAITKEVLVVFNQSIQYMRKYNQIYLNEGHLLKAIMTTNVVDHFLTEENKEMILSLGTTSRDMITHLGSYTFPQMESPMIRRVTQEDFQALTSFVSSNFSHDWSETIKNGFLKEQPTIYIAVDEKEIVGFAAYDVYRNKKCYFGPMGVTKRRNRIGYQLLHHCLRDMKKIGYEYAIIGEAGPIEFYEKACNAVVIPAT